MLEALGKIRGADAALNAIAQAYVGFAAENPALYRLMFGPALAEGNLARPASTQAARAEAKAVLESIILRGARSGLFAIEPDNQPALAMATLSCWSAVHGLATLIVARHVRLRVQARVAILDGRLRNEYLKLTA